MSSKHFFNDQAQLMTSALRSLARTNPSNGLDEKYRINYVKQTKNSQVSVISGGGSGHEPSFSGFVGHGFLSAAVAGSIFASPSTEQIHKCLTKRVNGEKGILIVIMNYTGDALHFGMAVEKARSRGMDVKMVIVGDDVGVGRTKGGRIGQRGLAGICLVQKIAGALAATGATLEQVFDIATLASANTVTVGASLQHVHVPGRAALEDERATSDEVELGMGIHNEEGCMRLTIDLPSLVTKMLSQLLDESDTDRAYISVKSGDPVALLINNLGSVSCLEIGGITEEVCQQLQSTYEIVPARVLSGTFMSSLNGNGFSISILKLADSGLGAGKSLLDLLDAPSEATGWQAAITPATWNDKTPAKVEEVTDEEHEAIASSNITINPETTTKALKAGLRAIVIAEPEVTKYDTLVGDGDCGLCLKGGAEAVLAYLSKPITADAVKLVAEIANVVEQSMDGTSGALYAIFLNALASSLRVQSTATSVPVTPSMWSTALQGATTDLGKYTPARPGDRTLVDSLHPFVKSMAESGDLKKAVEEASKGCDSTMGMVASLGRSVYVGGEDFKTCPDPGAYGLVQFLKGLSGVM